MSGPRIELERLHAGAVWRIQMSAPPGQVLDMALCVELVAALKQVEAESKARLVILSSNGPHFSFGASVEEHRATHAPQMLSAMRELLLAFYSSPVPSLAIVRGYCLGGGLELALCCSWIASLADARLGFPEISLGVMPPFALALLPRRVAGAVAEDWLLSGRHFGTREAEAAGLVRAVLTEEELPGWLSSFLAREILPRSTPVLRLLRTALRAPDAARLADEFAREEQRYLHTLLQIQDAHEGLEAFLGRRPAQFRHS